MPRIILEAANEVDTPGEELAGLVNSLRDADPTLDVSVVPPHLQRGYGVTFWEVIRLWVESEEAWDLAKAAVTAAISAWVSARVTQRAEKAGNKEETKRWWVQPTVVTIFGPDGSPLVAVKAT
jgi:hypothetical protein